jgi:bifunctional NMN adenylyltransferase/nudix hydrolase
MTGHKHPFDCVAFIGRFQPFHEAHAETLARALEAGSRVVIIIGSAHRARSITNPFTLDERIEMIRAYVLEHHPKDHHRVHFEGIEDRYYNEARWLSEVKEAVTRHSTHEKIALIGYEKDNSSYYLKSFPEWTWIEMQNHLDLHSTDIRRQFFTGELLKHPGMKLPCSHTIRSFLEHFQETPAYSTLCESYQAIEHYKKEWSVAPYPPTLVTVDALVLCHQHILLICRGHQPGHGRWAMPGGFLDPHEWIQQGIIRELIEETKIDVAADILTKHLRHVTVFDYPTRSPVGRVITHVGTIRLAQKKLPTVKGSDDAAIARWFPLSELPHMKDQFHDDHYLILNQLLELD